MQTLTLPVSSPICKFLKSKQLRCRYRRNTSSKQLSDTLHQDFWRHTTRCHIEIVQVSEQTQRGLWSKPDLLQILYTVLQFEEEGKQY